MIKVKSTPLPNGSFLETYRAQAGCHTDCFSICIEGEVDLKSFTLAFFDSGIFRLERLILATFSGTPSSRSDVAALASGSHDSLASWKVEKRSSTQLLLSVKDTPIRTWLMVSTDQASNNHTHLYFGSALLPTKAGKNGEAQISTIYKRLMPLHLFYSKLLLWAASKGLNAQA